MNEGRKSTQRWWLGAFFLTMLVGLSLFPPDLSGPLWKDPVLIALGLAMLVLLIPMKR